MLGPGNCNRETKGQGLPLGLRNLKEERLGREMQVAYRQENENKTRKLWANWLRLVTSHTMFILTKVSTVLRLCQFCLLERESHYVVQAGLELSIILPCPLECLDFRCRQPCRPPGALSHGYSKASEEPCQQVLYCTATQVLSQEQSLGFCPFLENTYIQIRFLWIRCSPLLLAAPCRGACCPLLSPQCSAGFWMCFL